MLPSGPFPGKWTFFGLLSGRCDNCPAEAAPLWCDRECLHARRHARKQAESERRRTAWICRRRQPPLFQRCRGETGERVGFRRHIWKCWNSPHARGHPICMLLTSTQPICGRCERRKEGDGREREKKKGGSFIYSVTTSPVSSSSSSSSSPQTDAAGLLDTALCLFSYLFPHINMHNLLD